MAKGIRSFLPQLSIAVPAITTGMLIFSEKVDPITSLLSSSGEEKKEDSSIEKTSKQKGDKEGDEAGKEGQKGKGETGDGKDKGGKLGEGLKDGSSDGKGQGTGEGGSGDPDSKGDSLGDAKGLDGGSPALELNKLSGVQVGSDEQGQQIPNQVNGDPQGSDQNDHAMGDSQTSDGQENSDSSLGSVISGSPSPDSERREVNGGSVGGETIYFAPAFSEFFGIITSEDVG
ncbi:hypothetical protein A6V39_05235 [Candidatus Mycoplasma haematobovis]|uniref:Uncharacterized protein n=1 Tax=Candidatus Mycoplasma haematobovis TaxID=432608 RepID=A0A1A9QB82_9MOLU|nr:hypothetical protein [Candidatus Mycoplasma haematobovis]OAL09832.1 hypothetical protein A6V39_05235 [Candidatus Mycoplasma haematobovis]